MELGRSWERASCSASTFIELEQCRMEATEIIGRENGRKYWLLPGFILRWESVTFCDTGWYFVTHSINLGLGASRSHNSGSSGFSVDTKNF